MNQEKTSVVKCGLKEDFFIVPGYERFSVNRKGFVYDRELERYAISKFRGSKNGRPYLVAIPGHHLVHYFIAITFLDDSHIKDGIKRVVNHIDGNTLNNAVENLEWTTYSGNAVHAYSTGLRNDNIPLLCKDIRTNEITRFYSYWDCARKFNTNGANIFHYFKSKRENKLFKKYYILIKENDKWPIIDTAILNTVSAGCAEEILLIDKNTNDKFIFDSINKVCKHINIKYSFLSKKLKYVKLGEKLFVEVNNWLITFLKLAKDADRSGATDISSEYVIPRINNFKRKAKKVEVIDLNTKHVETWESLEKFGNFLGVKKNSIQKHILVNSGIYHNKYSVRYLD